MNENISFRTEKQVQGVLITEGENKRADLTEEIIYPSLDSCLGITIQANEQAHGIHLVLPFEDTQLDTYLAQLKNLKDIYEHSPEAHRSAHISFNRSATRPGTIEPSNSHYEIEEHISHMENCTYLNEEKRNACIELLEFFKDQEISYEWGDEDIIQAGHWQETYTPPPGGGGNKTNTIRYNPPAGSTRDTNR